MIATPKQRCEFSPCRKYRYTLWREWFTEPDVFGFAEPTKNPNGFLMVIGLNPSTADETQDDPTIRRCIGFAKAWGYDGLCMTNLFAWRDTSPESMKLEVAPIGPENDKWLYKIASDAGFILAAWGKDGIHQNRAAEVRKLLISADIHCLRLNKDSSPQHPLYVPANTIPIKYTINT